MSAYRKIRVSGIDLNVLIEGSGPPVLLVHGFPDDHTVWRNQVPALVKAGYTVIAPDTRGCGASDMPTREQDYALARLVADLRELLDALGVAKVRMAAHDWGAVIGWQFCTDHPDRVERYAALSVGHPTAYAKGPLEQKLKGYYVLLFQLRGLAEWGLKRGDWAIFRKLTAGSEDVDRWIANLGRPGRLTAHINYYRANLGLIFPRETPKVEPPVMGVFSDGDKFLAEAQMRNSAKYARKFRYEKVTGASHWLQLDAPDRVNALLLDFFKGEGK